MDNNFQQISKFEKAYSEKSFFDKIKKNFLKVGLSIIEKSLTLYYSALDADTPKWAKGYVFGTLGYFISPLDFIPDFTPIVGLSDDIAMISAAFTIVALYIKPLHKEKAKNLMLKFNINKNH